jgi:GNAT superfamily N-acetyltransferase
MTASAPEPDAAALSAACFGCEVVVEGPDPEAIADRFVEHAREAHEWAYPERSLRNYARNTAEAPGRVGTETRRRDEIGAIEVHPVTAERIDDWLELFDTRGFADHPDWASCYCLEPYEPPTPGEPERYWQESRAAMTARLGSGRAFGYLAYADGVPAGWVNAALRTEYGLYRGVDPDGPDAATVIGVSCFVIAPPFRRHGVAAALLDHVIAAAAGRGAAWIEGYPYDAPAATDAAHFRGPRALFDARGFEPVEQRERDTVVRRPAS